MRFNNLKNHLRHVPIYRPRGLPGASISVAVFTFSCFLEKLSGFLAEKRRIKPACVVLIAPHQEGESCPSEIAVSYGDAAKTVPVISCETYYAKKHRERMVNIFYVPEGINHRWTFSLLPELSTGYLCVDPRSNVATWTRHDPDFYQNHGDKLEYVYTLLEDDASCECLAGYVRGILLNSNEYTPIAPYRQYFHPQAKPCPGDTLIDGGVGGNTVVLRRLLRAVGKTGCIFSFEPIPRFVQSARKELANMDTVKIVEAGLGAAKGMVTFADCDDGSQAISQTVDAEKYPILECAMWSLDEFVAAEGIERIDCIKLDVEGGELDALKGAASLIREQKPKLAISLYHKSEDLWELPEFLATLCPAYTFWMGHHSMMCTETVLYASARSK